MFRRVTSLEASWKRGPKGDRAPKAIRAFDFFSCRYMYRSRRTVVGALGTGGGALVARVTRDTHDCGFCSEGEE